jgi:hypothetical protein
MLDLPSRENCVFGYVEYNGEKGWGAALLQGVTVQVDKPARSHIPFRVMGSFPGLHATPTDTHNRRQKCMQLLYEEALDSESSPYLSGMQ